MDIVQLIAGAKGFEWDDGNALKNWTKHRVTRAECEQVFFNQPLLVAHDELHSDFECRFYALGITSAGRSLFIAFTLRGGMIRVISARAMHRKEREVYRSA